jgi:TonB family protein
MRTQLENIERAEKYLNKELNATEHQAFEQELTSNPELKATTEGVRNLQAAAFRNELRKKIKSNSGGNNGKVIILGVLLFVIGMFSFLVFNSVNTDSASSELSPTSKIVTRVKSNSVDVSKINSDSLRSPAPTYQTSKAQAPSLLVSHGGIDTSLAPKEFMLGGHKLWAEPDIQTFVFESNTGATIEGKDGILIIVPSKAFVDSLGKPIPGEVKFRLVEALSLEQMVLYRLQTVSNGALLESGGMFFTDAEINGQVVGINPKRPLYIEIPTTENQSGMMAFRGEVDENGVLNWVEPKALKKYLVKIPLDQLDFLPSGFEDEVKANMPFLNYQSASIQIADSLYYSLAWSNQEAISSDNDEMERRNGRRRLRGERGDSVVGRIREREVPTEQRNPSCGIEPVSIETIKKPAFAKTYIATKEFETRVSVLHKAKNGNDLLQVYVDNLSNNLWIADSIAASKATINQKARFREFAAQNLTNIKDADIYQKRLSDYYVRKRKELKRYHETLAAQLATKNAQELSQITRELTASNNSNPGGLLNSTSVASWVENTPRPNAATSQVYATPWFSSGWGNIDQYFKLLRGGTVNVPIMVSNTSVDTEVTQWLTDVNTYTNLNGQKGAFLGVFPKKANTKNATTHVFAMAESEGEFSWGMARFNPYKVSEVEFDMATASIDDIKNDLRGADASFGVLRQRLIRKQEQAKKLIIAQVRMQQKREAWMKKRAEIIMRYTKLVEERKQIETVMTKLKEAAFPCEKPQTQVEVVDEPEFFTIVEDMPQFPGGDAAVLKFIRQNTQYPEELKSVGISETPYVSYVVDPLGAVTDIRIIRSSGNDLMDQEALRVVSLLQGYVPGRQRGKPIAVQFTIPIRFKLN